MASSQQEILDRLHALREPAAQPDPASDTGAGEPGPEPEAERAMSDGADPPASSPAEPEPAGEPTPDADEIVLESLDDLATHLGVERDQLYNIRVPVTDATGKRADVSLGEWKDGYTSAQEARRRAQEYERLTATLREEQQRYTQETQSRLQALQTTLAEAERLALAGLEDSTLERMRAEGDPDYGTRLAERMHRERQLAEARRTAEAEAQRLREEHARRQEQALQERRTQELQALLTQPEFREWRDEAKFQAGAQQLTSYAQSIGFGPQELERVYDHRVLTVLEKARRYDESQKQAKAAIKSVVRVGKKVAKPGATTTQSRARSSEVDAARKRLKQTGSIADAARLLQAQRRARQS